MRVEQLRHLTAFGFGDEVFIPAFGFSYAVITDDQRARIVRDIRTCNPAPVDPMMKDYIRTAFDTNVPSSELRAWDTAIKIARSASDARRAQAALRRPATPAVTLPPAAAPGSFDAKNRNYTQITYADAALYAAPEVDYAKCQTGAKFAVGIDLPRNQEINESLVRGVFERVLVPLAQTECPGSQLGIQANFYHRTLATGQGGRVVPAGSADLGRELPLVFATYSPARGQQPARMSLYFGGMNYNWPELASLDGMADFMARGSRNPQGAARQRSPWTFTHVNYTPSRTPQHLQGRPHGAMIGRLAARDFFAIEREGFEPYQAPNGQRGGAALAGLVSVLRAAPTIDPTSDAYHARKRGFVYAVQAYDEQCRASLGPDRAVYRELYQELERETANSGPMGTFVTRHWVPRVTAPVYMERSHHPLYVRLFSNEKAIIFQQIFELNASLPLERALTGESALLPLQTVDAMKADAAAHINAVGCAQGKVFLQNWADYINGVPAQRYADGKYPTQVEEHEDGEVRVSIYGAPASEAPVFPYRDAPRMVVDYSGERGTGLKFYQITGINGAFLPGSVQRPLMDPANAALRESFRTDRIRILHCAYGNGAVNYFLAGYGAPNAAQRALLGPSVIGVAAACPVSKPN